MASSGMQQLLLKLAVLLYVLCKCRAIGASATGSSPASERDVLNKATTIDERASATGVANDKNMLAGIEDCRCVCFT